MTGHHVVLCAIADDDQGPGLLDFATNLALEAGYELVVAHVVETRGPARMRPGSRSAAAPTALLSRDLGHAARLGRADGEELLRGLGVDDEIAVVALGNPCEQLLRLARECDAALLVVGTRGRGAMRGALLGTLSRSLTTRGDTPVVVVHPEAASGPTPASVICGVAGTLDDALAVARVAAELAGRLELPLTLAHVLETNEDLDAQSDVSLSALLDDDGWRALRLTRHVVDDVTDRVDAHAVLRRGDPAHELAALGREHDAALVVVGCHRHRAARTLLVGSVSLDLCRRARRPVITVPIGARRAG